jgi:DNA repair protein RadC
MVVLMLNTRKRVKGHQLLTIGTLDTVLVHPREVFRCAIIAAAASIVLIQSSERRYTASRFMPHTSVICF